MHADADSLSQLPIEEDEDSGAMFKVSLFDGLPVTTSDIAAATTKNPKITQVYHYVLKGWS